LTLQRPFPETSPQYGLSIQPLFIKKSKIKQMYYIKICNYFRSEVKNNVVARRFSSPGLPHPQNAGTRDDGAFIFAEH